MSSRAVAIARALLEASASADGADGADSSSNITSVAREHVANGPLDEALLCLALAGDASWLDQRPTARARVDLLLWEAGAAARLLPELGAWLASDADASQRFLLARAEGSLRERALAARTLAICADGFPSDTKTVVIDAAARLASHPEAVVWIPAVRGLGRLSARCPAARLQVARWQDGPRPSERRRALAALASAPRDAGLTDDALREAANSHDPWYAASLGVASPHLCRERPQLWRELAPLILERRGAQCAWSIAQGLSALRRHSSADHDHQELEAVLRQARERALAARSRSTSEAQLWLAVREATDFLDGVDPDPAFPDANLERAVRDAVRSGARRTVTRATAAARSITATFDAMLRAATASASTEERGHALAAVESCTRAVALGLWRPLLAAAGRAPDELAEEQRAARAHLGETLAGYLELDELGFTMRRAALRGLGHLVDAEPREGRSRAAAFALSALAHSKWARTRAASSTRRRFRKPVTDLLWRLGDALEDRSAGPQTDESPSQADSETAKTPGAALDEQARQALAQRRNSDTEGRSRHPVMGVFDTGRLGRVAAWWALSSTSIELLEMVHPESSATRADINAAVRAIRNAAASAVGGASSASWGGELLTALDELGASGTALARAAQDLLCAIDDTELAVRSSDEAEMSYGLTRLAGALSRMAELARDPAAALQAATAAAGPPAAVDRELLEELQRAVQEGEPTASELGARWAGRVGTLLRPAIEPLVSAAVARRREAVVAETRDRKIGPYRALRQLGGGGHGEVWLVQRDGRRRFVLKRPRRSALLSAEARARLSKLIEREAALLEGLHEGKVASFIDHGWDGDTPYLVLEYLVGVDLYRYASVRLLGAVELAPIVRDVCIGLRALHSRGIVHRDLKPSNVFLRLVLDPAAQEEFRQEHRDPELAPISDAVLIDFGVSRLLRDNTELSEAPEGTLGYLSPEQAESSEDVTGKSDIYALAATLFHVLTGRRFFQDRPNQTAQLVAHAFESPMRDRRVAEAAQALPQALVDLLDQATALAPRARPDIDEFARRYAAIAALIAAEADTTL